MTARVVITLSLALLLSVPVLAQNGGGADARPAGSATAPQQPRDPAPPEPVFNIGNGVTSPVLTHKVDPQYTKAAMDAKIQGEVWLDGVVEINGALSSLKVAKSLDKELGLDQAAIEAASKWEFRPGTREGKPVRVRVQLILEFRLGRRGGGSL